MRFFEMDARWWGIIGGILAAVSFSLIASFSRLAYSTGADANCLMLSRFVAFVFLTGLAAKMRKRELTVPRSVLRSTLWLALCMGLMSGGYLGALMFIPVNGAVVLLYSFPLIVGVLAHFFRQEKITLTKAITLLLAFTGLSVAIAPNVAGLSEEGAILALAAALGVAVASTFSGAVLTKAPAISINFWTNLWLMLAMIAYAILGQPPLFPETALGWVGLIGATLCYVMAYNFWFWSMRLLPPAQISVLLNLEPLISVSAAILILREEVASSTWLGLGLLLCAIAYSTIWAKKWERYPNNVTSNI